MDPRSLTSLTNDEAARFFGGVGADTSRAILRGLGLPKRRKHAASEILAALGLDPKQRPDILGEIMLRSDGRNALWDAARVADEVESTAGTVHRWVRDGGPAGFPKPVLNHSRKVRLWIPLEVRAFWRPSLYAARARLIRRRPPALQTSGRATSVVWTGTLQPLPENPT